MTTARLARDHGNAEFRIALETMATSASSSSSHHALVVFGTDGDEPGSDDDGCGTRTEKPDKSEPGVRPGPKATKARSMGMNDDEHCVMKGAWVN
ncbi:hypothetical protein PoB_000107900 [Plakobranchus ocellatus]|uniref:Uncharacterized protein n=1 Tax=Plakobranchus ocellatus TaxID=259542 RepID=A0AAV3XXT7_9GAST|nr:hypothetical protein PoB_000107900 [Plakobranchus ocellatus]